MDVGVVPTEDATPVGTAADGSKTSAGAGRSPAKPVVGGNSARKTAVVNAVERTREVCDNERKPIVRMLLREIAANGGESALRQFTRHSIELATKYPDLFLEFVREGVNEPGAQSVAERAGVSVRTVFRCFEDMEALYQELSAAVRAEFLPRAVLDLNTADRMERLKRLVANRVAMFGEMEPYRLAAENYRDRYETFEDDYHFLIAKERERRRNQPQTPQSLVATVCGADAETVTIEHAVFFLLAKALRRCRLWSHALRTLQAPQETQLSSHLTQQ